MCTSLRGLVSMAASGCKPQDILSLSPFSSAYSAIRDISSSTPCQAGRSRPLTVACPARAVYSFELAASHCGLTDRGRMGMFSRGETRRIQRSGSGVWYIYQTRSPQSVGTAPTPHDVSTCARMFKSPIGTKDSGSYQACHGRRFRFK
jgi:hypothetical protein